MEILSRDKLSSALTRGFKGEIRDPRLPNASQRLATPEPMGRRIDLTADIVFKERDGGDKPDAEKGQGGDLARRPPEAIRHDHAGCHANGQGPECLRVSFP